MFRIRSQIITTSEIVEVTPAMIIITPTNISHARLPSISFSSLLSCGGEDMLPDWQIIIPYRNIIAIYSNMSRGNKYIPQRNCYLGILNLL